MPWMTSCDPGSTLEKTRIHGKRHRFNHRVIPGTPNNGTPNSRDLQNAIFGGYVSSLEGKQIHPTVTGCRALAYKTPTLRGSPVPSVTFLNPIPQMWGDVTVRVSSSTECSWDIGWHVDIKQKPSNQSAPIKFNIPNMMGLFPNVSPFKYGVIWLIPMFNRNDIPMFNRTFDTQIFIQGPVSIQLFDPEV